MKKFIFILIIISFCVIISVWYIYTNYKNQEKQIEQFNAEYEQYINKKILGSDISTVINKAVDHNERNNVEKDEKGIYIDNNLNSIRIDIKLAEIEDIRSMETIYNLQIVEFMKYFGLTEFRSTDVQYHEDTKQIKYILFEEIQ